MEYLFTSRLFSKGILINYKRKQSSVDNRMVEFVDNEGDLYKSKKSRMKGQEDSRIDEHPGSWLTLMGKRQTHKRKPNWLHESLNGI